MMCFVGDNILGLVDLSRDCCGTMEDGDGDGPRG